jgi:hypothetical protein
MVVIGFIDDREDSRIELGESINRLSDTFDVETNFVHLAPLEKKEEYISWIQENGISVILLDYNLHVDVDENINIDYNGNILGQFLTEHFKDLPIFIFTSFPEIQELEDVKYKFNRIIHKTKFNQNDEFERDIFKLFINAGSNFHNNYHKKLERLGELSRKIALGQATNEEITEAKGIQQYLEIPMTADLFNDRGIWLNEFSDRLNDFEKTTNEIDEFLKTYNKDELDID